MKKIFIYVLWVLLSLPTAMASNTLVSNESEYDNAVENATAGDTIILKNGTWNNIVFEFYAEGTEADAIVMTAETAGEVILTGSSRLKIYGKYLQVQNLDFKDGASTGSD
ncbi:MAG: chondroitinase-B domain-containing protein, partial [Bacteroidia bacterium]